MPGDKPKDDGDLASDMLPTHDGGTPPPGAAPQSSELPEIDARSIVAPLHLDSRSGAGISLAELDRQVPVPKLRTGSDKYEVLNRLGQGGMGYVYLVYDRDLKRNVALKMMREGGTERSARFVEEARVMGRLQHPNILALYELGVTEGKKYYYTMPRVLGQTLAQVIRELRSAEDAALVRTYSLTRLVQIFLQITQALSYAHDKGFVHRDLKPANIMLGEHGEVQVLDWGLSKMIGASGVEVDLAQGLTETGLMIGTPHYMAPEQIDAAAVDGRTDIYALGVIFYELLTLKLPFEGPSMAVLSAHIRDEPTPPRVKTPGREIPLELERVCLKALAKKAEDRFQSVREMQDALQTWLEAESDQARRHELAEERVAEARAMLEDYRRLKAQVREFDAEAEERRKLYKGWQPVGEKAPLFEAEDRAEAARDELVLRASDVVSTITEALGFERDHAGARGLLADYYWSMFEDAEAEGKPRRRDFYGELVARYHDGKYARELRGNGSLTLASDPPGAEVDIYELAEDRLRLVPRRSRRLGTTPLEGVPIPMGSYLVVLRKEGFRDVRYPIRISRNLDWRGDVKLYTEQEIGPDFVYVPGGRFILGGDPLAMGRALPRSEPEIDGFFMGTFPVTMGEYLEFLNHIARSDIDLALRCSPRRGPGAESYLLRTPDGLLRLPDVDADGDRWDARWPVILVSWDDAVAYAAWRSVRDGVSYRLPSEVEWEKAARGVDGRWYPWGNRFDASLCNIRGSRRERPVVVSADAYPDDVSIYGVRGMAGNVQDWTATATAIGEGGEARDGRVIRGAGWDGSQDEARCAYREWNVANNLLHHTGFRLAK